VTAGSTCQPSPLPSLSFLPFLSLFSPPLLAPEPAAPRRPPLPPPTPAVMPHARPPLSSSTHARAVVVGSAHPCRRRCSWAFASATLLWASNSEP
jgi:hypothetical protein